jgi:hypothetical protein
MDSLVYLFVCLDGDNRKLASKDGHQILRSQADGELWYLMEDDGVRFSDRRKFMSKISRMNRIIGLLCDRPVALKEVEYFNHLASSLSSLLLTANKRS